MKVHDYIIESLNDWRKMYFILKEKIRIKKYYRALNIYMRVGTPK